MTITLELTPDVAASLAAQAQARGISLDTYVRDLIEEQAAVDHREPPMTRSRSKPNLTRSRQIRRPCPTCPPRS
jgi:hypothetical protein